MSALVQLSVDVRFRLVWCRGCLACICCKVVRSLETNDRGSGISSTGSKNCPGIRRVVPYTSSAVQHPRSSLTLVRMPRRTMGRASIHHVDVVTDMRLALSWRWNCSTSPLAAGWYAMVRIRVEPRRHMSCCHRSDSNWLPWSVVMDVDTPKRAIQLVRKACATDVAVMSVNGTTSGQRVKRSTQVKR